MMSGISEQIQLLRRLQMHQSMLAAAVYNQRQGTNVQMGGYLGAPPMMSQGHLLMMPMAQQFMAMQMMQQHHQAQGQSPMQFQMQPPNTAMGSTMMPQLSVSMTGHGAQTSAQAGFSPTTSVPTSSPGLRRTKKRAVARAGHPMTPCSPSMSGTSASDEHNVKTEAGSSHADQAHNGEDNGETFHFALKQSDDGMFYCDYPGCTSRFNTRFSLKRHTKRHTGVRPFRCKVPNCQRAFAEKATLLRHTLLHELDEENRPYMCKTCGMGFRDWSSSRRHTSAAAHDLRGDSLEHVVMATSECVKQRSLPGANNTIPIPSPPPMPLPRGVKEEQEAESTSGAKRKRHTSEAEDVALSALVEAAGF